MKPLPLTSRPAPVKPPTATQSWAPPRSAAPRFWKDGVQRRHRVLASPHGAPHTGTKSLSKGLAIDGLALPVSGNWACRMAAMTTTSHCMLPCGRDGAGTQGPWQPCGDEEDTGCVCCLRCVRPPQEVEDQGLREAAPAAARDPHPLSVRGRKRWRFEGLGCEGVCLPACLNFGFSLI